MNKTENTFDFQDLSILDISQFCSLYNDPIYFEKKNFLQKIFFQIKIFFMFLCMYFFYERMKHKIFCLKNAKGEIAGIIEISLQTTENTLNKCSTYECTEESIQKLSLKPYISSLAVSKKYRNLGIGMRLLAACEEYSLAILKSDCMYLHALRHHKPAYNLYVKNGFKDVSHLMNESGEEIIFMKKCVTSQQ